MGFDVLREANAINNETSTLTNSQRRKYAERFKTIADKIENLPDARSITNRTNNLNNFKQNLESVKKNRNNLIEGKTIPNFNNGDYRFYNVVTSESIVITRDNNTGEYEVHGIGKPGEKQKITSENIDIIINKIETYQKLWEDDLKQD